MKDTSNYHLEAAAPRQYMLLQVLYRLDCDESPEAEYIRDLLADKRPLLSAEQYAEMQALAERLVSQANAAASGELPTTKQL